MKLTIRYVKQRGVGRESHEVPFNGDRATIGRGTNQSIQILDRRVPLSHSTLSAGDVGLELRAASGYSFTVNGQVHRRAELKVGDVVNILGHEISVLPMDADEGHVLEVEIDAQTVEPLRNRFRTRLWELNFPQRQVSWTLFLIVLLVGVGIPSVGFITGMPLIRSLPLPDDGWWQTGKLHDTHVFLGSNCEHCHALPFVPARDEECLNCHLSVRHHFNTKQLGRDYKTGDDCQDCHQEHSGDDAIIRNDQEVCTVCHADLAGLGFDTSQLRNATDFLEDHPSFMISMLELNDNGSWTLVRRELWDEETLEDSNLKFSHELHMDVDGINGVDGVVILECTDCHVSEKGGLRMTTVTMEKHCANCHQLTFDSDTPDRVVPHGQPEALMMQLRGYYAYRFLNENSADATKRSETGAAQASKHREARRPGKRTERTVITTFQGELDPAEQITAAASAYVDEHVRQAAANLFEKQTCVICHDVSAQDGEVPWKIEPVRLTADWYPMAEFSHEKHKNMACSGCHDAMLSAESADVLMPDIVSCRGCHGGEHASNRVQSSCIACHKFHIDKQGPMGILLVIDEDGNLVDTDGNFVDEQGNITDQDGNLIIETSHPVESKEAP